MFKLITQTSLVRIYGLFVAVIFLSLTARWFGPEGRGQLAAILTWVGAFSTIGYLSLGQAAIRQSAISTGDAWLSEAFGALTFWTIISTFLGSLLALAFYQISDGKIFGELPGWLLMLGFFLLPLQIWENHGSSLLIALERLDIYNRYQFLGKSFSLVALIIFVLLLGLNVDGAIYATIIGQLVLAAGCFILLWRMVGRPKIFNYDVNVEYIKRGLSLHLNAVGAFIITASDVLMLNYYHGAELTGYYQLGVQLTAVLLVIPQSASMVLYGKVASEGPDLAWKYHRKILLQITLLMIVGAILAGLTVQWWLVWFAGESFSPAIDIFRWQLLSIVGMTFSVLMGSQWVGRGYFWQISIITLIVAIFNIFANIILIPKYGMYGAIWSTLGVYAITILVNGLMVVHCNNKLKG